VGYSSVQVATEQVAAQEKQRVLGIPNFYVNYDSDPAPMTAKLKFKLALKVAVDPVTILGIGFIAGLDQAGNTPDYQQGAGVCPAVWRCRCGRLHRHHDRRGDPAIPSPPGSALLLPG
jgi:hypothetical protein